MTESSAARLAIDEDRALRCDRLMELLGVLIPLAAGFSFFFLATGVVLRDGPLLASSVNVLGLVATLFVARGRVRRGDLEGGASLVAYGMLAVCVIGALLMPWLRSTLMLMPLAGATLVVADLDGQRLRRVLTASFVAEIAVVVITTWFRRTFDPPPMALRWFVMMVAPVLLVGLMFLLLIQDGGRLRRSIASSRFHALKVQAVVEQAPVVLFAIDQNGIVTLSEGRGLDALELRTRDIVGHSVFELNGHHEWVGAAVRRVLRGQANAATGEYNERTLELHLKPLENGGAIGVLLDVTERQRAEDGLRLLSEVSRALGEPPDDPKLVLGRVAQIAVQRFATQCSIELVDDEGALFPAASARRSEVDADARSTISAPLLSRDGRPLGMLTVSSNERRFGADDSSLAEDLAARAASAVEGRELYTSSQRAIRIRDEFLSIASHELKTPLTPLRLVATAIERAAAKGDIGRMREKALGLQRHVERLSDLIDELLDVARIRAGRVSLERREMDVAEATREVIARMEPQLERAGCPVTLEVTGDPVGLWDPSRIDQILTNLVSNAAKYAPNGPIAVEVHGNSEHVRIAVTDHGIGISPADQTRIFKRFERAVSDRNYGGLGLGLFIVNELVSAHGGEVSVRSSPGEGSTFEVKLPRLERISRAS